MTPDESRPRDPAPADAGVRPAARPPTCTLHRVGLGLALLIVAAGTTVWIAWPGRTVAPAAAPAGVAPTATPAGVTSTAAPGGRRDPGPLFASARSAASSPTANTAGVNLALGKPTLASSTEADSWDARNAVDGDPGTRWTSQWSDPQWIRIDLGGLWSVSTVKLLWQTEHATRYNIETSIDGNRWTVVRAVDNGDGGTDDEAFPPTPARYLEIFGIRRSSGYGYSLWEIEVR